MWTKSDLNQLVVDNLQGKRLILVSNREPYRHTNVAGSIEVSPPVSGMVTAMDPIMRACGGVWIAHGSGNADRKTADEFGRLKVPPDRPAYTLRRVWLTKEQEYGYYNGLSNEGLWPLCHMVFSRPVFNPKHWPIYRRVNEKFAETVFEETEDKPSFVFLQDFHFGLTPKLIKERNPNHVVAHFWHIPWPSPDAFQTFPWKEELLDGLLGNDLLGFHLRYHCQNFLDTVDRTLEAKVDRERFEITRGGKTTVVRPFPISIDFTEHSEKAASPEVEECSERWRKILQTESKCIGIGIDRLDYTKGILERFRAIDRFMEKFPEYREKFVFAQIGVPSRSIVPLYQQYEDEVDSLVEEINWRWSTDSWRPIEYFKQQFSQQQMMGLHRIADFCVVSSLDDGMNLVAKEFIASRTDGDGLLILSKFTGAARELTDALMINPFDVEEIADAMKLALTLPPEDRQKRMKKMRQAVSDNNIYRWAGKFLSSLLKFDLAENGGQ